MIIAVASLVSSGIVVCVFGPKLGFLDSLSPILVNVILFTAFIIGALIIAFVLFVVTVVIVLISEGGYGYYSPTTSPEEVTAVRETREARWRINRTRVAATEIASANRMATAESAMATAETAFPVLATRRAWLEGLRQQSDGYLDGAFDPCVPAAGAFDPCAVGRLTDPQTATSATSTRVATLSTVTTATVRPTPEVAGATPTELTEVQQVEIEETVVIRIEETPDLDTESDGSLPVVHPCAPYPGSSKDPCERRVPWEWPSLKNPNFLATIWAPSPPFTAREWIDWKFRRWHTVPHFIVRGVAVPGSTRCASHGPPSVLLKGPPTDSVESLSLGTSIDCYTDIAVREYIFGTGPSRITFISGGRSVDEISPDFGTAERDSAYYADITSPLTESLEGYEWIFWLTTPLDASQGAWKASSMWDVQRRDDGAIVGVSRSRVGSDVESVYLDELEPTLQNFVTDTKAAMAHYVELYSGKIGDSSNAPSFISSPDLSSVYEYIKSMGALDIPGFTFTPPPPSPLIPTAPTDLYGELWTDPQPEVDLAWTAPASSQVTTYKIMRVDSLGTEVVVAEIPAEFVEVTDRHLPIAGAEYTYTVIAVNEHGESAPSAPFVLRVP